ncbi:MAG: hypothetical protein E7467_00275 [Ruminococcaceae bacterium]|nr:hypothetical protein [Oscillospiraceae bacterium]
MDYDRVIVELLNRIGALEDRVAALEGKAPVAKDEPTQEVSKKYRYLADYLHNSNRDNIRLTFSEIEEILKTKLPSSAHNHRAFWANTTSHSIALSWLTVGYETVEVNTAEQYIVFEKKRKYGMEG